MRRVTVSCFCAGLLLASPARPQIATRPLCEVGRSALELLLFWGTRVDSTALRSSIIYLAECPSSIIPVFSKLTKFPVEPAMPRAWIEAVRSAARDSSNTDLRAFLTIAQASVARLNDRSLSRYLDGIFQGGVPGPLNQRSLDSLFERQAVATLTSYARCGAASCYDLSDIVLFLLGTHPIPMLRAMRVDSVDASNWLHSVAGDSFAGDPEGRDSWEGARRAVLATLAATRAPGFERQRHACESTLRGIRYRAVQ